MNIFAYYIMKMGICGSMWFEAAATAAESPITIVWWNRQTRQQQQKKTKIIHGYCLANGELATRSLRI